MGYRDKELLCNYKAAIKPADIRGKYPDEIDEILAYRVARAFISHFDHKKLLVARDMRLSSESLHDAFIAGATDQGADVVDIGLVGSPALYFASGSLELPGVMITASHNPKDYNGLKLIESGGIPLTDESGLSTIESIIETNDFKDAHTKGNVEKKDILEDYKTYLQKFTHIDTPRNLQIVVDAGNGMGTTLAPILEEGLPITIIPLFFKLDGTFPNRGSNPALKENQKSVREAIKNHKPDFGVAFDGDVDRVAFFDEKAQYINSAVVGAVIVDHMLLKNPGATCVYTNFTSKSYFDAIVKKGGKPLRARVGHAFIKRLMRKENALFACEHSAHFYFKSNYFTDSGIITLLMLAEVMGNAIKEGEAFSEVIAPFDRYFQTEEVLVKVADKKAALKLVEKHFTKEPLSSDWFDGLHMEYDDVWFTVKESITEDALKFVVESKDKERALAVQKEIDELLH